MAFNGIAAASHLSGQRVSFRKLINLPT